MGENKQTHREDDIPIAELKKLVSNLQYFTKRFEQIVEEAEKHGQPLRVKGWSTLTLGMAKLESGLHNTQKALDSVVIIRTRFTDYNTDAGQPELLEDAAKQSIDAAKQMLGKHVKPSSKKRKQNEG